MRTSTFLLSLLFSLGMLPSLFSQKLIALHHEGAISYFTELSTAYDASVSGDTLYLPGGSFDGLYLQKSLTIIGVGHHPDSTAATGSTVLFALDLGAGASNSSITGIYLNYTIVAHSSISNVSISRCYVQGGILLGAPCSNWIISENWIKTFSNSSNSINPVNSSSLPNNFFISNNVLEGGIGGINSSEMSNNIFLTYVVWGNSNTFKNNIFYSNIVGNGSNSQWFNNLNSGINGGPNSGGNTGTGNYLDGASLESIFVNYSSGNTFYQNDFHVVNPAYLGDDGMPVGIYGGAFPWKEGSLPYTPHIRAKTIGAATNPDGTLHINITVKAQGN